MVYVIQVCRQLSSSNSVFKIINLDLEIFLGSNGKDKGHPATGGMAQGVPDRLSPRHYKGGRSSSIRAGRLFPRKNPWYSLSEDELTSGHMVSSVGATEKIPCDTIGNRSRDRPNSSAVP